MAAAAAALNHVTSTFECLIAVVLLIALVAPNLSIWLYTAFSTASYCTSSSPVGTFSNATDQARSYGQL